MSGSRFHFGEAEAAECRHLIDLALAEDLGDAGTSPRRRRSPVRPVAVPGSWRCAPGGLGRLAGDRALERFQLASGWKPHRSDGNGSSGTVVAGLVGPVRSILTLERTALNFLQRLSGIATLTARFVAAVQGTRAVVLDTRDHTRLEDPRKVCGPLRRRPQSSHGSF